jgi:DNA-binding transcriptional regulator YhcF (GntR family)
MTAPPPLRVDTTDPTPPYEQLRRQLVDLIGSGVLGPGDRLPPLRQLAADLGLAVGTVARTYRELETAGLVASRRGGGTRVQASARPSTAAQRERDLRAHAAAFVRQARLLGASDDDVRAALAAVLPVVSGGRPTG